MGGVRCGLVWYGLVWLNREERRAGGRGELMSYAESWKGGGGGRYFGEDGQTDEREKGGFGVRRGG